MGCIGGLQEFCRTLIQIGRRPGNILVTVTVAARVSEDDRDGTRKDDCRDRMTAGIVGFYLVV